MSLIKELICCDDPLRERSKILLNSATGSSERKVRERRLSLTHVFTENDLENWKKCHAEELAALRDWLGKQAHLPKGIPDQKLLAILHSCLYSVEQAKSKIDSHYTIRTHAPEIFLNRSAASKEMILARRVTRISPLRFATPEGYNVIFVDSLDSNVANYNFTEALKLAAFVIDVLVHCFPEENGNVLVFDMKNSLVAHVIKTNLALLKKAMVYVNKGLPFVLKQVHVINAFPLIHQIQMLIKPFVDDSLSKKIHIHMQDNMESFYKFIPKKSLPKDYGGEADSLQELNEGMNRLMFAYEHHLRDNESLIVDESKRTNGSAVSGDLFGLQGSFKNLDID